uniref:3-oxoacyl-[acyl-carrier-protein] reductase n=1 Tax=Magnetococcus massalia (strain MO-1) TaxID=451514 RepID=A0A1S7LDH6_MAGMO|nr:3-oxoacyl-[acyl-carrier-protein] reductase [Candidatus Magnetococcus massalia]
MKDRVAIVTGSTAGLGKATALELARQGAQVIVTGTRQEKLEESIAEIEAAGGIAKGVVANVTEGEDLDRLVAFTQENFGKIDILVNNAGITRDNLFIRMKDEEWDQVMAVNLTSIFQLTKRVTKLMMKARYGRIINITSVVGFTGNGGQVNYTATKAGLVGFSKSLAKEVARRGITVNCVAPGFIQSAMTDVLKEKDKEAILAQIPVGEMGQGEDIARAVAFLAQEQARYITGETLHVNGGMLMP